MNVSPAGVTFTHSFEGCSLVPYLDQGGTPTQGWGETGPDITMESAPWTQDYADARFLARTKQYDDAVNADITVEITQPQHDALFDFSYNEGGSALAHSTLCAHINSGGDLTGLFEVWDKVRENGHLVVSKGLLRRREAEDNLYTNGNYGQGTAT